MSISSNVIRSKYKIYFKLFIDRNFYKLDITINQNNKYIFFVYFIERNRKKNICNEKYEP